jgi:2-polyprenyl-3-methyl-5-hydroxy-6-metoxy-1,4-benzoquinol methylase
MQQMEWTPKRIALFWANEARTEDNAYSRQFGRRIAKTLAPHLRGCRTVLDYGCGFGFFVRRLAALGLETTATDLSPEAVAAANNNNRGVAGFHGARLTDQLRQSGETFDAVVATEIVEHMYDDALTLFFDDMRRLLKPGGRLLITTPNEEDLTLATVYCPACDHEFHRWQHVRSWSADALSARLVTEGFHTTAVIQTNFAAPRIPDLQAIAKRAVKRLLGRREREPNLAIVAVRTPHWSPNATM